MLVLSRRKGEAIVIDNRITVRVLAIRGSRVQLAFDAPTDVLIRREELCSESPNRTVISTRVPEEKLGEWLNRLRSQSVAHESAFHGRSTDSTECDVQHHHDSESAQESICCEIDIAGCV